MNCRAARRSPASQARLVPAGVGSAGRGGRSPVALRIEADAQPQRFARQQVALHRADAVQVLDRVQAPLALATVQEAPPPPDPPAGVVVPPRPPRRRRHQQVEGGGPGEGLHGQPAGMVLDAEAPVLAAHRLLVEVAVGAQGQHGQAGRPLAEQAVANVAGGAPPGHPHAPLQTRPAGGEAPGCHLPVEVESLEEAVALGVDDAVLELVGGEGEGFALDGEPLLQPGEEDGAPEPRRQRRHQQAVVAPGVGAGDGARGVAAPAVGDQPLPAERGRKGVRPAGDERMRRRLRLATVLLAAHSHPGQNGSTHLSRSQEMGPSGARSPASRAVRAQRAGPAGASRQGA